MTAQTIMATAATSSRSRQHLARLLRLRRFEAKVASRGDGKRFVVHADEKLTAFLELELAIRAVSP